MTMADVILEKSEGLVVVTKHTGEAGSGDFAGWYS